MNLYGFAGGDPVNFSDPFGLCPEDMGGDGKTKGNGDCPKDSKGWNQYRSGAVASAPFSPLDLIPFGAAANSIRGLLTGVATEATSNIAANKLAGDAFRDEIAGLFREAGYGVRTEVGKRTPFGRRVIDIEISRGGNVLGGIETKVGKSPYTAYQRAKDAALYILNNYPVQLVRTP